MGTWITIGVLILLAILPLGVRVVYDASGPVVKVVLGLIRVNVYPRRKKEKRSDGKKEKKPSGEIRKEEPGLPKHPEPPVPKPEKKTSGGSLTDFLPFVKLGLDFLGDLRKKIRLNDLYLRLVLASSDPCDLAINYGKTWTAVGNLMPVLERCFVIKKRDVEVECDFTASETKVVARLEITMTLGRLLTLVAVYAFRGLKEYIQFRNNRKGGALK